MIQTIRIEILHDAHVGTARTLAHEAVLRLGGDAGRAEDAATVAAELAENIVRHTPGGEILLGELKTGAGCSLELHALDRGPGIRSVAACLRGFPAASGTGLKGLAAVKQRVEGFQIHTRPGQGTVVWARCGINGSPAGGENFDYGGVSVAVRGEEMCGDAWDIYECLDELRLILTDGLGHGPLAAMAARKAISVFQKHVWTDLPECLKLIHQALTSTRGAAATLARLDNKTGAVTMAGIGNVTARILKAETTKTFSGDNGTLGAGVRKITEYRQQWDKDSVLVMHSDGISSRWDCSKYPGLEAAHPGLIAGTIYRDFRNRHDDSTVMVVRQRREQARLAAPA